MRPIYLSVRARRSIPRLAEPPSQGDSLEYPGAASSSDRAIDEERLVPRYGREFEDRLRIRRSRFRIRCRVVYRTRDTRRRKALGDSGSASEPTVRPSNGRRGWFCSPRAANSVLIIKKGEKEAINHGVSRLRYAGEPEPSQSQIIAFDLWKRFLESPESVKRYVLRRKWS